MRPRHRLQHEIGLALACKALALGFLYVAFFMPAHGVDVTAQAVSTHLLAPAGESGGR